MHRYIPILILLVSSTACLTTSDLEEEFPFSNGEACPDGTVSDGGGDCVSANDDECQGLDDGSDLTLACCQQLHGECCVDDTDQLGPCEQNSTNNSNNSTNNSTNTSPNTTTPSRLGLLITDTTMCGAQGSTTGADLHRVFFRTSSLGDVGLEVLSVTDAEEMNDEEALPAAQSVLPGVAGTAETCSTDVYSLDCGAAILFGFSDSTVAIPDDDMVTLEIFETGMECDQDEDSYQVSVCDLDELLAGAGTDSACLVVTSSASGVFDITVSASIIPF